MARTPTNPRGMVGGVCYAAVAECAGKAEEKGPDRRHRQNTKVEVDSQVVRWMYFS